MTCVEAMRKIRKKGWLLNRTKGSHYHFKHPDIKGLVTIPFHPSRDLSSNVLHIICRATGIS